MPISNPFFRRALPFLFRRRVDAAPASAAEAHDEHILQNRYIAGKLVPRNPFGVYDLTLKRARPVSTEVAALVVPPREMWEGYGVTEQEYLQSGERHMAAMQRILADAGANAFAMARVLDLGCAAGRMLRFFPCQLDRSELWGVDINARYIEWCQNHLGPPMRFATITTAPHLPFEDCYFDLVFCGSVFTHITDLADAWLLEIRRVLRDGGHAYITIQDKTSMAILLSRYNDQVAAVSEEERSADKIGGEPGTSTEGINLIHEFDKTADLSSIDYATFSFSSDPASNIFYDTDYLIGRWCRFIDIISVTPRAYGCQTALLCRK